MIKNPKDKFETLEEFYDNLNRGGEIEFEYHGKEYAITHSKVGICIYEAEKIGTEVICKDVEDIGEYLVGTVKLKTIVMEINVTFRCF
ncbi:hypothetical protein GC098_19660 [Paenibacillus sp. LMG 31458]|uniref:Uncharacterized protein n=1 Tax=Paenibacillus phytorum TaxID=2654977 RepID=A0ABX1Y020_9BACL|nr:hypothetical protein [Paenibacillus phytorum]NOU73611.1 hypothetical protein [Paenibacillus phytorum]